MFFPHGSIWQIKVYNNIVALKVQASQLSKFACIVHKNGYLDAIVSTLKTNLWNLHG